MTNTAKFQVVTKENSCAVTMNDNATGAVERVITGKDPKFIAYAVFCFAMRRGISPRQVGYTVKDGMPHTKGSIN